MTEATLSAWIRRDPAEPGQGALSLRFEVEGARGMLRIAEDGVLVDGPALTMGEEGGLDADQVRSSRLVLIAPEGRESIALDRLSDDELASLPHGAWMPLELATDDEEAWLEIAPPSAAVIEAGEPDTMPTQASLGDLPPTSIGLSVEPPPEVDGALLEGSALVRHLRRSLSRERMRAYALEQRVLRLETLLADRGVPLPRHDTGEDLLMGEE